MRIVARGRGGQQGVGVARHQAPARRHGLGRQAVPGRERRDGRLARHPGQCGRCGARRLGQRLDTAETAAAGGLAGGRARGRLGPLGPRPARSRCRSQGRPGRSGCRPPAGRPRRGRRESVDADGPLRARPATTPAATAAAATTATDAMILRRFCNGRLPALRKDPPGPHSGSEPARPAPAGSGFRGPRAQDWGWPSPAAAGADSRGGLDLSANPWTSSTFKTSMCL